MAHRTLTARLVGVKGATVCAAFGHRPQRDDDLAPGRTSHPAESALTMTDDPTRHLDTPSSGGWICHSDAPSNGGSHPSPSTAATRSARSLASARQPNTTASHSTASARSSTRFAITLAFGVLVLTFVASGCGNDAVAQESTSGVRKVCVAPGEGLGPEGGRADYGLVKPYRYCDRMNSTGELWDWPVDATPPPEPGDTITDPKSSGPLMVFGPPTRTSTTPPVQ